MNTYQKEISKRVYEVCGKDIAGYATSVALFENINPAIMIAAMISAISSQIIRGNLILVSRDAKVQKKQDNL